jgi:hypothetical protein
VAFARARAERANSGPERTGHAVIRERRRAAADAAAATFSTVASPDNWFRNIHGPRATPFTFLLIAVFLSFY